MKQQTINISVEDFLVIREALLDAINDSTKVGYKQNLIAVDPKTSKDVKEYTQEQVDNKEVVLITDKYSTFTEENAFTFYDAEKLTPVMLYAHEKLTEYSVKNSELINSLEGAN